jgi:cytochrome c peroxidase
MRSHIRDRRTFRSFYVIGLVLLAIVVALAWKQIQSPNDSLQAPQKTPKLNLVTTPIQPLPREITFRNNEDKFRLGETLFTDPRLSQDGKISCASCHNLQTGGADRRRFSVGVHEVTGTINVPTVFNVAYNFRFNWDGKFSNLVDHTDVLMQRATVMGIHWPDLIKTLETVPKYRQAFADLYNDGITRTNIIDAIIAYETALITPNSPFDRYLQDDQSALSPAEQEGYRLFNTYGCVSCHQGINVGGNMFQKFGIFGDYVADRGNITTADFGRFNVTGLEADRYIFRVPSLRNVAITPPYLHDGNAATLEQAIAIMAKYQLGRTIPPEHIQRIALFLHTLTGEYQGKVLSAIAQ